MSGSSKDLLKAIQAYLAGPTQPRPLPEGVIRAIDAYLQKHDSDGDGEKLQSELLSIYRRHVENDASRLAGFIAILCPLVAALRSAPRILQWWDLMEDKVAMSFSSEKGVMSEVLTALQTLLSNDNVDGQEDKAQATLNPFVDRLISDWMDKYHLGENGGGGIHVERTVKESLVSYGKRKPKEFLEALDQYFARKEYRVRAATLLCDFIENKPPHLYEVLQTPLFGNILRCLQLDTSTTVVSMALTALIMLLPHMPSALANHLPTLFNVYARLLFWHREQSESADIPGDAGPRELSDGSADWELCAFIPGTDGQHIAHLLNYFTILYGLYPVNLMDYIRKPQRYLRHANAPDPDSIEVQSTEIRHHSEKFSRLHLLHPNFYNLTVESERSDHGRWQTSEPADLVAECMALCTISSVPPEDTTLPRPMPGTAANMFSGDESQDGENTLLSSSAAAHSNQDIWRLTQSTDSASSGRVHSAMQRQGSQSSHPSNRDSVDTRSRGAGGDSPTLPPHLVLSTSHASQTQLQDMINSNKVIKSGIHQSLANDSVPSLSLSQQESVPDRPASFAPAPVHQRAVSSPVSTADSGQQLGQLRRQVLLLQNDLSFERYLKQQHVAHIGEIRRRQVKEAASEAETQNLINANRVLRKRFEEAKQAEMQVRKESEMSRTRAKKLEADLQTKLRSVRDDLRKTKAERDRLLRELDTAKHDWEKLKKRICEAEVRELSWEQTRRAQDIDNVEIERLKAEVDRLAVVERDFMGKEAKMKAALEIAHDSDAQVHALQIQLDARDRELQQATRLYETNIVVLKSKLLETRENRGSRPSSSVNALLESALAASRAKQLETQKQYSLLMRKYTVLQSSLLDMKSDAETPRPRMESTSWSDDDGDGLAMSTRHMSPPSPSQIRNRPHRVFSNPEAFDNTSSYNATPPLDTRLVPSQSSMASPSGSSTPVAMTGSSSMTSLVTDSQVHYGRGGAQNRIRKDSKDKKTLDSDKKEKKATGFRGLTRNFV